MKGNPDADKILTLANQLYQNEHKHKIGEDGWTVQDNLKWRQEYAPQILGQIKETLLRIKSKPRKYPPKSQMYKAANCMLNEWDGIEKELPLLRQSCRSRARMRLLLARLFMQAA